LKNDKIIDFPTCSPTDFSALKNVQAKTATVKLHYNVLLGTGKISTLYPRYVVTKNSTVHTFISNPNTCISNAPIKSQVVRMCSFRIQC